jgi:nucleotide-binding universal stress UspA family protein
MAEGALPVAVGLASPLRAALTLFHVQESAAPRTIHGELHLREGPAAEAYLADVAETWKKVYPRIDWHVHPNPENDVARSINEHALELGADVVVLTTHGRGGLRDFLFGSIAQQVVRGGKTPTLIVRPTESPGPGGTYLPRTIVVPLDGSSDSEPALGYAREIAGATGARIILASIVPTIGTAGGELAVSATFSPNATAEVLDLAGHDLESYLQAKAGELRTGGANVETILGRGRATRGLSAIVEEQAADLVILATHGRSGLDSALSGSVAPHLLSDLRQPVLLIRIVAGSDRE